MFGFDIDSILKGYTPSQEAEARVTVLINYLWQKDIIDPKEYFKYEEEHFKEIIEKITERDKEKLKKYEKENK